MKTAVDFAVAPAYRSHGRDAYEIEEGARRFEPPRRIVIARDEGDDGMGPRGAQILERVEEQALSVGRGIQAVENIARDDDRVDLSPPGDLDDLRQSLAMLRLPRPALQSRAKVPVGGMKNFDHGCVGTGPIAVVYQ
jgi:hypothetical protein